MAKFLQVFDRSTSKLVNLALKVEGGHKRAYTWVDKHRFSSNNVFQDRSLAFAPPCFDVDGDTDVVSAQLGPDEFELTFHHLGDQFTAAQSLTGPEEKREDAFFVIPIPSIDSDALLGQLFW